VFEWETKSKAISLCGVAMLLAAPGCAKSKRSANNSTPVFSQIYKELEQAPASIVPMTTSERRLTLSCEKMPLPKFLQFVATETGVSLVADEGLDSRSVTLEASDVTLAELLGTVARRLGVQIGRVGSTWYLGQLRGEDRGVLVRRVRRLSQDGVKSAVDVMLSDAGRLSTFPDGLLVCGDRVEVLERIRDLLDRVEASGAESWAVQLYLISLSETKATELGINAQPLIELSHALATKSNGLGLSTTTPDDIKKLSNALTSVLKASASSQDIRIVAQPLFLLLDGESSKFSSGISIPIPKRSVSDQGTVTTQGYEFVNSGLDCDASIREVSAQLVRFKVAVELGQLQGFVEEAPIRSKDRFETVAVLSSGGVYLLGSLSRDERNQSVSGPFSMLPTNRKSDGKRSDVQIWAKVFRVGGPASMKP
jgi:type II secretory pathway component GspD/PulD (secretin)